MLTSYKIIDRMLQSFAFSEDASQSASSDVVWFDLEEPTDSERNFVNQLAKIAIPTRGDMEEIEVSSRLYSDANADYMTVTVIIWQEPDIGRKEPVVFILTESTLVTVRYAPLKSFGNVIERFSKKSVFTSFPAEQIFLALLDALVDRLADALEIIGDKLDAISQKIFYPAARAGVDKRDHDLQKIIESVGHEGDLLGRARESLVSINRLSAFYAGIQKGGAHNESARARTEAIQRDVSALSDHASYLTEKATFLLEATLGLISIEQNQIIKIFSVVGVCLMPPTLVASVYGMNFKYMPELTFHYGYPLALLAMLASGVAPYFYFRRKRWF